MLDEEKIRGLSSMLDDAFLHALQSVPQPPNLAMDRLEPQTQQVVADFIARIMQPDSNDTGFAMTVAAFLANTVAGDAPQLVAVVDGLIHYTGKNLKTLSLPQPQSLQIGRSLMHQLMLVRVRIPQAIAEAATQKKYSQMSQPPSIYPTQ